MPTSLHVDEIPVDLALVRRLLAASVPKLADRPLTPLPATGSSNVLFRLGDDLLVRVPRQPGGAASIEKEARWLPHVAPALPVGTPEVVAVGEPAAGYPERWSVVRWVEGQTPGGPGDVAPADLVAVLEAFRRAEVPDGAHADGALRWYRGGPLAEVDEDLRETLVECRELAWLDLDLDAVAACWDLALDAARSRRAPSLRWYHGDLLAENLLVCDGRLAAVLDFGGLGVGDPAVDLMAAWEVLDAPGRRELRDALEVDEATWLTAAGWALLVAVVTFPYYGETMKSRCASRLAMARAVLEDLGH
ncbi:aminoglycoside phosphotransferase family protein [Nocardioides sp. GCM10027113]|uniref:aminoglycoside phosphotransferase family protein n=1 Tax=unclassified Nocardioides TaxID=2615069 RepID=UPI00361C2BFA